MAASVLMITRARRPDAGGMERFSWELTFELSQDQELSVTILAHAGSRRTSPLFALTVIPRALAAAKRSDVVHLGDPMLSLVGWLIKKILHKPVAITVHGLDVSYPPALYQLYLKLFFRNFDLYLPISEHVDRLLAAHRVTGRRTVVHPSIRDRYDDPAITRADLEKLLRLPPTTYTLQPGQTVLFTAGRLVKRKGQAWFVVRVLPHLPANTVYVIAGDGPERESIIRAAESAGVATRVVLLGKVSDADLKVLYNTVDVFIQPNLGIAGDVEGFGLVLLEAASAHRTVLAANVDGIPNAIHNGQSGWLLPAGDAHAWQQQLQRVTPLPQARTYTLKNFAWPKAATEYRQAFLSLVARHTTVLSP